VSSIIAGIFVGGASTRMGRAKGLLPVDGTTLVERTLALFDALRVPVVLVGVRADYAHVDRIAIADDAGGAGPLGGLVALLRHAPRELVIAVACDMPFLAPALVERLIDAPTDAAIVAPRRQERWEPFFARYDAARVLPVASRRAGVGNLSLQGLLDEMKTTTLELASGEGAQLDDWDVPEDIARAR
jgi:molybdenum cofactor guanylyltransferase